jgi:homoaconitate hydratase
MAAVGPFTGGAVPGQTVVEKIAQAHLVEGLSRSLRAGDFVVVRPDHVMTHDNTAPVIAKFHAMGATMVADPRQPVFVLDHDIQNHSAENVAKYEAIERFAVEQGIDFYPAGTGIGHQVMVEQQYVVPGAFVVGSDSHSNMYGALGAVGTPVVRTDAAALWATGHTWWQVPRTVLVRLEGELRPGVTGKDVILALCGTYSAGEVLNAAVEFGGPGVAALSIEERLTISNMTTEWGALAGWFPVDQRTLAYLEDRRAVLAGRGIARVSEHDLAVWADDPVGPDDDAAYAGMVVLDLSRVAPHISGPDTVQVAAPLPEFERHQIAVDKAYLVSCVNSRAGDIAAAARVVREQHVAPGVEFYVAAASSEVQAAAEEAGDWQTLLDAGAIPLPPGCGPCIGLGTGLLEPGEVGISAAARNFKGRMGSPEAASYLASPEVVAASAIAGFISGPRVPGSAPAAPIEYRFEDLTPPEQPAAVAEIVTGFPAQVKGRVVFLARDDLNTDGIYGREYTYRDGMTPAQMAEVVFANYDPGLRDRLRPGDVIGPICATPSTTGFRASSHRRLRRVFAMSSPPSSSRPRRVW